MSIMARGSMMKKAWIYILMAIFVSGFSPTDNEKSPEVQQPDPQSETTVESSDRRAVLVDVQGPIGPATVEFLVDSLEEAATRNAELLIIRLDTPGGLDASTRDTIRLSVNASDTSLLIEHE